MESTAGRDTPSLPLDLVPLIINNVTDCSDLLNLCLVNHCFAYYTRNKLYDGSLFLSATLERPTENGDTTDSFRRVRY